MHKALRQYILEQLPQQPQGLEQVLAAFRPQRVPKRTVLLDLQRVCRHCYFIVEGCIKLTSYTEAGTERTLDLAFEGDWRTSMQSFLHQTPAVERLVAVEDSQLLAIEYDAFQQLCADVPGFDQLYRGLLEQSYTQAVDRVHSLMNLDALDRLRWLLDRHPLLFTRLSNRLIASYLGLSEATLSRLKAKL